MNKQQYGFSLIEILVAVAIIGILAKMAYPSYVENIKQGKRADAKAALVSFANAMEMYKMQNNNSYSGATVGASGIFPATVPISGGTATYNLTVTVVAQTSTTPEGYTLTATPVDSDATCGNLTLDNLGATTASNDTTKTKGCW